MAGPNDPSSAPNSDPEQEIMDAESERHATNLELFLDLVFVFAVTQITGVLADHHSALDLVEVALLAFMAWWQWTAFTWAGSAVDLERSAATRVVVLALIGPTLLMAITIPEAFGEGAPWFGGAYLLVMVLVTMMQGVEAFKRPDTRSAYLRYAPLALSMPAVVFVGSFFPEPVRLVVWAVAMAASVGAALVQGEGSGGTWTIDPVHFAERHALFMIICLGEILVAVGAKTYLQVGKYGLDAGLAGVVLVTVSMACAYWWSYFAYIPKIFENALASVSGPARATRARDIGSMSHFPVVCGLILYAVVAKHVIEHPFEPMALSDRWMLFGSLLGVYGGFMLAQFVIARTISRPRSVTLAIAAAWILVSGALPAVVVIAGMSVLLIAVSTYLWRRVRVSMAHVLNK